MTMHDQMTNARHPTEEVWYTPAEIAARLKVPEGSIQRILATAELGSVRIGDEIRISGSSLARFLRRPAFRRRAPHRRMLQVLAGIALVAAIGMVVRPSGLKAQTATPTSEGIPYHGYLEENGAAFNGRKVFIFCLMHTSDATSCAWTESYTLDVTNGRFSVLLGQATSLDALLQDGGSLYLKVSVDTLNGDMPAGMPVELAGRQLIGSIPYARRGSPGKDFLVDGKLSSNALAVQDSVTVGQSVTVANQVSAKQLNLSGRIIFSGVTSYCIIASNCPSDWTDKGRAGFETESSACPFELGGGSGDGGFNWCRARLCCN
jgi:excisionase family DNA binding protein